MSLDKVSPQLTQCKRWCKTLWVEERKSDLTKYFNESIINVRINSLYTIYKHLSQIKILLQPISEFQQNLCALAQLCMQSHCKYDFNTHFIGSRIQTSNQSIG